MYKPNFCAECGARVQRARWRLWTSRKFCETCAKQFRRASLTKRAALTLTLLGGGFLAGRAGRQTVPPLIIARNNDATSQTIKPNDANSSNVAAQTLSTQTYASNLSATNAPLKKMRDGKFAETPLEANELVSICGARTLKGTPCSRRVRGTGHRCWQHIGKPAMLPPEKLVVQGKLP